MMLLQWGFLQLFVTMGAIEAHKKLLTVYFMWSLVIYQLLTDSKGAPQIVNNNLLLGLGSLGATFLHVHSKKYKEQQKNLSTKLNFLLY